MRHDTGDPKLNRANRIHDIADVIFNVVDRDSIPQSVNGWWEWARGLAEKVLDEVDSSNPLSSLQRTLFEECETAGWDPEKRNSFGDECAHLHEEVSEAFRAFRLYHHFRLFHRNIDGKPEGVPAEFADVLIGLFYNAELNGFDLMEAVWMKHRFNLQRSYEAEGRRLHP